MVDTAKNLLNVLKLKQLVIWLATKLLITLQVSKALPQNSSETVTNETENTEYDKEIPK